VSILIKKINFLKNTYFFKKKTKKKAERVAGPPLEDPGVAVCHPQWPRVARSHPSGLGVARWPPLDCGHPFQLFLFLIFFFKKISIFIYFLINLYFFY
jgi:hypothetical protein